jgi:transketolase N-terminal domain/subunit
MADSHTSNPRDQLAIDTIRFLAVDMVEAASSGHPGAPMGQAAMAYNLWARFLRFDPQRPDWPNRDRFVLSCGHASALLYALLHLAGYELSLDDLRDFRQLGSMTPGHPERGETPGVETTTGPLGQGLSNAVGMAIAQRLLAARFNREGYPVFDHRTFVFASDGDLMEGVASEASSMAGHLELDRLIVFYDDNRISIDGPTSLSFSEDVGKRYEAYGWHVQRVEDGNDLEALAAATEAALADVDRPSLVAVRTHIGFGSPAKQDTSAAHGSPLGAEEAAATKKNLGWPEEPAFHVPDEARATLGEAAARGARQAGEWDALLERYRSDHPELAAELDRRLALLLPDNWQRRLPGFTPDDGPIATRKASPQGLGQGARSHRPGPARASGRIGRPDAVQQHLPEGCRRLLGRRAGRQELLLRSARARNGRGHERHGAVGPAAAVRRHLPDLLRLHAAGDPPGGAHGTAGHLRLHPRFDLPRRGRADPPAGEPAAVAASHPKPDGDPARRRQRDLGRLARGVGTARRPHGAGAQPAEAAGARRDRQAVR